MHRRVFASALLISLVSLAGVATAQMPPHPKLLEQLQNGVVATPSVLQDPASLRARGIDAPWASPATGYTTQSVVHGVVARVLGPAAPPSGSFKALAILVAFSDKPAQVTAGYFDTLLFVQKPGSMRDYYKEVSYGNLDIITINMPGSLGWYDAPHPYTYYVNDNYGMGGYPKNSQKLVEDLVAIADPYVDFSKYDNDGDGYVDALFIIHAGPGAEFTGSTTDVWSHAWSTQIIPHIDGVSVLHYSIEPEYWQAPRDMTIGVYAHELGHAAFGLPDLYDRDYSSEGLGRWSLMAGGSWNGPSPGGSSPALPDAWSHIQMGFVTPTVVTTSTSGMSCQAIETAPQALALWSNGVVGSEYFLVENRQRTGYDSYLPGSGLLVFHVDVSTTSQNDAEWFPGQSAGSHYLVALEQADGNYDLERNMNAGDSGDPYPGKTGTQTFTVGTKPGSMDYAFQASGVSIQNISTPGPVMTADLIVDANDAGLALLAPYGGEVWRGGSSHQITWAAVNVPGDIIIDYSIDGGATWNPVGTVAAASAMRSGSVTTASIDGAANALSPAPGSGSPVRVQSVTGYAWTVPEIASSHCKVRLISAGNPVIRDLSPSTFTITPSTGPWSIQFNWDATSVTGSGGNAGAIFIPMQGEFWTSRWNGNTFHRWGRDGSLIGSFTVGDITGVRGMTFDGTYIYASNASTTINIINPSTREKVGTITSPVSARYIAYDPSANGGSGGFWVGDYFGDPTLISRQGNTLRSLSYASLGSSTNYSVAYDNISAGGPHLWFWGQGAGGGTPQVLVQVNAATGLPTGVTHDITTDAGAGVETPLAGGLFFTTGIVAGKAILGGMLQGAPNRLFGYEIADVPLPIQLASFTGNIAIDGVVRLAWMTLSEVDNFGFEVQKRADSTLDFMTIANSFVAGSGPTAEEHFYSFTDSSGPARYYRLKQIDRSGGVHYSEPITPTSSTTVDEPMAPARYALYQNYPNPFNPGTGVRFQVPGVSDVKLVVYDILGKEVAVLVSERKSAGTYETRFDGSGLASGVYIYRLVAGPYVETRRMLLVK